MSLEIKWGQSPSAYGKETIGKQTCIQVDKKITENPHSHEKEKVTFDPYMRKPNFYHITCIFTYFSYFIYMKRESEKRDLKFY